MHDLTSGSIAILRKYMRDPVASVGRRSALGDLGIDDLDLPMICLDLEDAYGVQIALEDDVGNRRRSRRPRRRQPRPEGAAAPASPAQP